ncbi:hypothetical protein [Thiorhodococcus fuscus]|uniref:YtxH domain-containing protein n=1 Tax=Thiorhodococcus fuscus TaxID=527200 RepID=A0ABW4Y2H4_9GAMM
MSQNEYQQGQRASQYPGGSVGGGYSGQAQPGMPYHTAYPASQPQPFNQQPNRSALGLPNDRFLKGMLIGAAATYLLTNEQVQRTAIKGAVKVWSLLQGGVEEVKEKFGDAAAELHHASQKKDS